MPMTDGKTMKFFFGDIVEGQTKPPEIEIKDVSVSVKLDEDEATTSQTTGDGKAKTLIRKTYQAKVSTILKAASAEITGNTLAMSVGGASVHPTKVDYNVAYDENKITNAGSPAGFHDFGTVRAEYKGKIDAYLEDGADLALSNTGLTTVITLATGHTITGTAKYSDKNPIGDVNSYTKNSYSFAFEGAPVEVSIGLAGGLKKPCVIEYANGKSYTGTAIIFTKDVTSEVDKNVKIAYGLTFTGTVTEAP
jgi:hypothetical protein